MVFTMLSGIPVEIISACLLGTGDDQFVDTHMVGQVAAVKYGIGNISSCKGFQPLVC